MTKHLNTARKYWNMNLTFPMTKEISEAMENMGSLSSAIMKEGREQALAQGLEQQVMIPDKIREMIRIYKDWSGFPNDRTAIFYSQARFMADYEDSFPWEGSFECYCPVYQDLTPRQLRGYFAWRTKARQGDFGPIPMSAACIYVYELLNGIGASSPEETVEKLLAFESGYCQKYGELQLQSDLRDWMLGYAVFHHVSPDLLCKGSLAEIDKPFLILRNPGDYSYDEVFRTLSPHTSRKVMVSQTFTREPDLTSRVYVNVWRRISNMRIDNRSVFLRCFGVRTAHSWEPMRNAVYYPPVTFMDLEYRFSAIRVYRCKCGVWKEMRYQDYNFQGKTFRKDLQEALLCILSRELNIPEKKPQPMPPGYEWLEPIVLEALKEEKQRPSVPPEAAD